MRPLDLDDPGQASSHSKDDKQAMSLSVRQEEARATNFTNLSVQ